MQNNSSIYTDIAKRTNGDVYIGVVGPVRCGKSTFIQKFMQNFVMDNITNKNDFNKIVDFIFDSVGSYVSPRSISDTLRSSGTVVDKETVAKYLDALCEAYLIYKVPRFEIKGKGLLQTLNKYYVVDPCFAKVRLKKAVLKDRSHWLENMVYLELLRRNKEVFIGKRLNSDRKSQSILFYLVVRIAYKSLRLFSYMQFYEINHSSTIRNVTFSSVFLER